MEDTIKGKIRKEVETYLLQHFGNDAVLAQNESEEIAENVCNSLKISNTKRNRKGEMIVTQKAVVSL